MPVRPQQSDPVVAHSQRMIAHGSKSFAAAARLFDAPTRASAYMLYAWCRYCDDQVDGQRDGMAAGGATGGAGARLERLREQTRRALQGEAMSEPVFAALQRVVAQHNIPPHHAFELLEGFAMDVAGRQYAELDDTLLYCYHVAGVVGVMMAHVMGVHAPETLHRAADLGIAFQLTNIARDVVEDAAAGRVYLPGSWLVQAGVPPAQVGDPVHREAVFAVVARLLAEADRYYASADQGLAELPVRCAWAVACARGVYRDIGRIVMQRGAHAWDRRAVVSGARKAALAVTGLARALLAVAVGRRRRPRPRVGLWTHSERAPRLAD